MKTTLQTTTALTLLFFAMSAQAQTMPDSGRTIQEMKPAFETPKASPSLTIAPTTAQEAPEGGVSVSLQSLRFTGNTVIDTQRLQKHLSFKAGESYDYAALKKIAQKLTHYYQEEGYPFARAFLPPQALTEGDLLIQIYEGRYGAIRTLGEPATAARAQQFLAALQTGDVIESNKLEHATLVLQDQPGLKATPIIRPGKELGTGDLEVRVKKERALSGQIGFDNHGNRYNGEYRGKLDLQIDSPFQFGDQIKLTTLGSDELLWLGSIDYSMPLGSSGLRGQIGYAETDYELGKQFKNLDAWGYAKISSASLSYPLIRSQKINLTTSLGFQHKDLYDKQGASGTTNGKNTNSIPVTAQFDIRDNFGGGAITYGSIGWTHGHLDLDEALKATDRTTAKTEGDYDRVSFDLARIQTIPTGTLPGNVTLYGRVSGQLASNNLDSSEGFGLGGADGVRTYPVGEGYGDEGWLGQLELRYTYDAIMPYIFYDAGDVIINARTWDTASNERAISGTGFGFRATYKGFNLDSSIAWRIQGRAPQSDTMNRNPRGWFTASYKF